MGVLSDLCMLLVDPARSNKTINNDYPLRTYLFNSYFPRFYLSFENSFCAGYVTEKFYKALSIDIVPIGNDSTVVKLLKVS